MSKKYFSQFSLSRMPGKKRHGWVLVKSSVCDTDFLVFPEILEDSNTQHKAKHGITSSAIVFTEVSAPQEF